ncbi:MAG: acetyl-CoA carboxylase biotin carboxyl carrier protein [Lachnospiraceae bacterium]|nr:acetyl-CoA carboxylase biotin carboxyl carrier protein [Lachnospiraceae bacterium]
MKIDDILTLIKAVSDSELTELELTVRREADGAEDESGTNGEAAGSEGNKGARPGGAVLETFRAVKAPKEILVQTAGEGQAVVQTAAYMRAETAGARAEEDGKQEQSGDYITSPMVGTFYSAPSEGAEPFISVGDTVKQGQVVGIVEAMKLMNEIESPFDGVVEKILVENKEMVGFGQELVLIKR